MTGVVKGRTYEEVDLMRESRAEDDVIADIAAEELEAYLGSHLVTDNYTKMAPKDIPSYYKFKNGVKFVNT